MKILCKKTGLFALHPVYGPVISCNTGEEIELDERAYVNDILASKWATQVVDKTESQDVVAAPVKADNVVLTAPWDKLDWRPRAKDAKDQIQDYVNMLELGVDLDLRKSVRSLINDVKELM